MKEAWTQDKKAETDCWNLEIEERTYGHITQYAGSDRYCWQAVRGDFRLAGIEAGREAAAHLAEETLALPVDEFNRRVTVELIDDLRKIERDILRLSPAAEILPGYHAGYEAGASDVRRRIAEALDEGPNGELIGLAPSQEVMAKGPLERRVRAQAWIRRHKNDSQSDEHLYIDTSKEEADRWLSQYKDGYAWLEPLVSAEAVSDERERCAKQLELRSDDIRLMAGEMTAQEMRTVMAVLSCLRVRMRSNADVTGLAPGKDDK